MATRLPYRVYDSTDECVAACANASDAAVLVAAGNRRIRVGRRIVWDELNETQSAAESYDFAARTIYEREGRHNDRL